MNTIKYRNGLSFKSTCTRRRRPESTCLIQFKAQPRPTLCQTSCSCVVFTDISVLALHRLIPGDLGFWWDVHDAPLTCQSTDQPTQHGAVTSHWPSPSVLPLQHRIHRSPLSVSLRFALPASCYQPWPLTSQRPRVDFDLANYREDHLVFVFMSLCGGYRIQKILTTTDIVHLYSLNLTTRTQEAPLSILSRTTYVIDCSTYDSKNCLNTLFPSPRKTCTFWKLLYFPVLLVESCYYCSLSHIQSIRHQSVSPSHFYCHSAPQYTF